MKLGCNSLFNSTYIGLQYDVNRDKSFVLKGFEMKDYGNPYIVKRCKNIYFYPCIEINGISSSFFPEINISA